LSKTNPYPSYRLRLRLLAAQACYDNLSIPDKRLLYDLLVHLADGGKTEDFFGGGNPAHRPTSAAVEQRVFDVCLAMAPEAAGGEGLSREQAISRVAIIHKVDNERINSNLKSSRGKKLYEQFSKHFLNGDQGD
jgi:hypothetical protein